MSLGLKGLRCFKEGYSFQEIVRDPLAYLWENFFSHDQFMDFTYL